MTGKREAVSILIGLFVLTACGGTQGGGGGTTAASVAIVPGGPHPYFEPMRGAIADATTDFKLTKGSFEVPTDWKQDLQNQLLLPLSEDGPGERDRLVAVSHGPVAAILGPCRPCRVGTLAASRTRASRRALPRKPR